MMNEEKVQLPTFDRIFLLEDDPSHALLIQRILKGFSATIVHTANLATAERTLQEQEFSLIISDLHVPDGEGVSLIEKIIGSAKGAPVLVLTSSTSLATAVEAMKLGAKDYIVKNFNAEFREVFSLALERTARAIVLEKERRRLQHEMAVLRIAVENGTDGLAILNKDGTVDFATSAFQEYVGQWGGSAASLETLFPGAVKRSEYLKENIRERIRSEGASGFWSTEISFDDDKSKAFRLDVGSLFNRAGIDDAMPQWVLWLRDISEERRREKFQREILSTTTHDLKGPLGAIILSSELITTSLEKTDRVRELALRISSAANGAVNLIDEFLSARRLKEGTFILKPVRHAVASVFDEILASYETMAKAKSISLTAECAPTTLMASFDKLGLTRVIGNLVTNALKFTPKGGAVFITAREEGTDYILSVRDTGSGMEPNEVKKLFERFSRLQKHSDVEGTGLGLFVVKCIVTAHGGRISVSSTPGAGTTFELVLPVSPPVNASGELISLDFT